MKTVEVTISREDSDAPVILCHARGILERLPAQWALASASGRLLLLSCFPNTVRRVTSGLAARRNEFVAALADEVFIAHANAGGHLVKLTRRLHAWCRVWPSWWTPSGGDA